METIVSNFFTRSCQVRTPAKKATMACVLSKLACRQKNYRMWASGSLAEFYITQDVSCAADLDFMVSDTNEWAISGEDVETDTADYIKYGRQTCVLYADDWKCPGYVNLPSTDLNDFRRHLICMDSGNASFPCETHGPALKIPLVQNKRKYFRYDQDIV